MSLKMNPQTQPDNPHVTVITEVASRVLTDPGQLIAGNLQLWKYLPNSDSKRIPSSLANPNGIPSLAQGCEERSALEKLNPKGIPSLAQGCEERATLGKRFEMPPNPNGVASPRFRNLPK